MKRYLTSVDDTAVIGYVDNGSSEPFGGRALMYLEARIERFFGGDKRAAAREVAANGWSNGYVYFRPVDWQPGGPVPGSRSAVDDPDTWLRLQDQAAAFLNLPDLDDDAELRRSYKRDPKGRFSSGGGGAGAGGGSSAPAKKTAPAKAAPAKKAAAKKAAPAAAAGEAGTGKVGPKMARQPKVDNPHDVAAQARAANPRYGAAYQGRVPPDVEAAGDYVGYTNNCTRVAIAYEMRRRGIDATAGAATQRGGSQAEHFRSFREDGKYPARLDRDLGRSMSAREVAAEARSWPVGARGIVTMDGHTLNIERTSSGVRFVDAQTGSRQSPVLTPAQFASRAASRGAEIDRGMAVARVDDLDMSDYSLHYVETSALSLSDGLVVKTPYPSHPGGQRLTDEELAAAVPDDSYP